jgi:RNA polymerase sigma-70 factor (ECF subfamily)
MVTRVSIDSEALLEEVHWVRALARRLVRDAGEAEDVAQEALVVALGGARAEPTVLRRWLGAVVRNLAHNARRRAGRRARRETPLDGEPAFPSTLELIERAATQRALVGALLELSEPDRSVLLLRYFEELSNEEVARRSGVPASTVASRLARAHARLREKWLAQNGEDRSTGLAALAALGHGTQASRAPPAMLPTGAALGGGILVALTAAGVLAVAAWRLDSRPPQRFAALLDSPPALARPAPPLSAPSEDVAAGDAGARLASFLREGRLARPATETGGSSRASRCSAGSPLPRRVGRRCRPPPCLCSRATRPC